MTYSINDWVAIIDVTDNSQFYYGNVTDVTTTIITLRLYRSSWTPTWDDITFNASTLIGYGDIITYMDPSVLGQTDSINPNNLYIFWQGTLNEVLINNTMACAPVYISYIFRKLGPFTLPLLK